MRGEECIKLLLLSVLFCSFSLASNVFVNHASFVDNIKEWEKMGKPQKSQVMTINFAVKQNNLEKLEETLWAVSDPTSPQYGNYLTREELGVMVGVSEDVVSSLYSYFTENHATNTKLSVTRDFIWADFAVQHIESLLNIELDVYSFSTNKITRTTDKPSLPDHIAQYIDIISGLWHFPETYESPIHQKIKSAPIFVDKSELQKVISPNVFNTITYNDTVRIFFYPICALGNISESLDPCSDYNNPITFYNITTSQFDYNQNKVVIKSNFYNSTYCSFGTSIYCISNSSGLLFDSPANITFSYCFEDGTCISPVQTAGGLYPPVMPSKYIDLHDIRNQYNNLNYTAITNLSSQSVVEFKYQFFSPADLEQYFSENGLPSYQVAKIIGTNNPPFPGVEASLDIQLIMGVGEGVETWFWYEEGFSYVTEWAQSVLNTPDAPWVHSISYGQMESTHLFPYMLRGDVELQKLGVLGFSILASAGDSGTGNLCDYFTPLWPASSPYVTAVGATRISRGATPECQINPGLQECDKIGEVVVSHTMGNFWSSGAGFSQILPCPSYQSHQVQQYLSTAPLPTQASYNNSGRAYPDISAVGSMINVVKNGQQITIGGTSASAPIVAGMISLLNDARFHSGILSPLGFLNPWIYSIASSTPGSFYDVTVGDNTYCGETCCPMSFVATEGWDVSSGWGTPNFDVLLKLAVSSARK